MADALLTEQAWFRDPDEVVIGTTYIDHTDRDWGYILLGRDELGQFRWIDGGASFDSDEEARRNLSAAIDAALETGQVAFAQGDEKDRQLNLLMRPVYPEERLHPSFKALSQDAGYSPAAHLITELAFTFTEPDGNFVEQFQTTGFDARMWELYLYVMLSEDGCRFDRTHNAPDFVCEHFGLEFSVEAVTMNPSQTGADPEPPRDAEELRHYNEHFTPFRFGRSLLTKLRRRYWELPHVADKPLVLAIHDFHQSRSMIWSHSGLPIYLYGYRHESQHDNQGNLIIRPVRIERHIWGTRTLRSGFFTEAGAENISAVLFSNSATISKFNRIGKLAQFGDHDIRMIRTGLALNNDPNADVGIDFSVEVDEGYEESWAEGVSVFHNPNARHPLPAEHFPDFYHHYSRDGQIETFHNGEFHPVWSITQIIRPE